MSSLDDQVSAIMYGIRMTESNGNYGATTGLSSASGAYQYLDSTWGHYGGYARAKDAPRSVQDAKARADIMGKWNTYHDWSKVAASWMFPAWANHPELWSGAPTPGNMTMSKYVNRILSYSKMPAAAQGAAGGNVAPTTTQYDAATLAARYGYASAFFGSDPELQKLIDQATKEQWTPEEFQARLQNTTWYRTHSVAQRQWDALRTGDPAEANRQHDAKIAHVRDMAGQMGVPLREDQIGGVANMSLVYGWDDTMIKQAIGAAMQFQGMDQPLHGQVAATREQLYQIMSQYGIQMDDRSVWSWVQRITSGQDSADGFTAQVQNLAKSKYPGLVKAIDSGQSVSQAASAYVQQQAQLLEIDPATIDLATDRLLNKALQYQAPAGSGQTEPTVMPLWQFSQTVKSDPRWMKTNNARDSMMDTGTKVLKDMGLAA